jgi:hypothetical protein
MPAKKTAPALLDAIHPLEALWALDGGQPSSSLASDIALTCRAFAMLPESDHEIWGARAAALLTEADSGINPFAPRVDLLPPPRSSEGSVAASTSISYSNSRADLVSALLETTARRASVAAISRALDELPPATGEGPTTAPINSARSLFWRAFERFCQAGDFEPIARATARGAKIQKHQLAALLSDGAKALDHPGVLAAVQACVHHQKKTHLKDRARSGQASNRNFLESFDLELFCCDHPAWLDLLAKAASTPIPSREGLDQLGTLISRSCQASLRDEKHLEAYRARIALTNPLQAKNLSLIPFDAPRLRQAKKAHRFLAALWVPALSALVAIDPVAGARAVVDLAAPKDFNTLWTSCGLTDVDAVEFIQRSNESAKRSARQKNWPSPMAEASPALEGARLTALDCFALGGRERTDLIEAAKTGAFGPGLARALEDPTLARGLSQEDALWLASFASNPTPSSSRGPLRV